jgi:glucans biosynthesis protein C
MLLVSFLTGKELYCNGGFNFAALRFELWEAVYCTGMCIGLLVLFREIFNWTNKFWSMLAADAYAAYLFHFGVVVTIQYCFVAQDIGPWSKFFIVSIFAVLLTFFVSHWIRKIPGVKRII